MNEYGFGVSGGRRDEIVRRFALNERRQFSAAFEKKFDDPVYGMNYVAS